MLMSERWRNDAKLPWELATVGANSQGESMWWACSSAGGVYLSAPVSQWGQVRIWLPLATSGSSASYS